MSIDFEKDMEELAAEIAVKAGGAEVTLHDQIDAFKALMPYLVMLKKHKPEEPEDDDLPTFNNFHNKLAAVK